MIVINQYKNAIPGLISRWPMNEGTGTLANDIAGGRHLTLTNGNTWGVDSVVLDGVNDYLTANCNLGLNGATEYSIAFWVKPSSASGRLIQKQIGTADAVNSIFIVYDATKLLFDIWNNALNQFPRWEVATPTLSVWTHYCFTWKKNTLGVSDGIVYANGSPITIAAFYPNGYDSSFVFEDETNNLLIGIRPITFTDPTQGEFSDIRIFNRQLTAAQVTAVYNQD